MTSEPLWSRNKNGEYCLIFPNKHAVSFNEIKRIFSKFGNVTQIKVAGNKTGFHFIQYLTLNEVERAINGLKEHATIKLVLHRPQCYSQSNCNVKRKVQVHTIQNDQTSKMENQGKSNNTIQLGHKVKTEKLLIENSECVNSDNNIPCGSDNSINSYYLNGQYLSGSERIYAKSMNDDSNTMGKQEVKPKHLNSNIEICEYNSENETDYTKTDDDIPNLVKRTNSNAISKIQILDAEAIIVANIHENYGCGYILHLFEHARPLAISYITLLPNSNTRYCYVYFETLKDTIEIEQHFDKYNLSGKKLIVLRPSRLIEEAMSN
ncbi:PREDICTED: uncharacterized protein LOC105368772 [Ceratosolen solmsi marchali]|uniref:Uncharacterized protein LOC105368772 n=1 Tax=Ceratosolen solmsi marchali TaxID=326594 RepID=A0AAJ6YXI7_9HYME|nr:PREDICTED: uncharacterized protein LOC105368772 [Ceratosolen solmsi marchali]